MRPFSLSVFWGGCIQHSDSRFFFLLRSTPRRFDWTSLPRRSVPNDVIYAPSNHSFSIVPKAAATAADNRTSSVRRLRRRRLAIFSFSELEDESERAETFSRAALALDSLDDDGGDDEEHKSPPRSGSGSGRMVLLLTADLEGIVSMYMAEWPPKGAVDDDDNDAKTEVDVVRTFFPFVMCFLRERRSSKADSSPFFFSISAHSTSSVLVSHQSYF